MLHIKMKCNNCRSKSWRQCCDTFLDSEHKCFVCEQGVKTRNYIGHLSKLYKDPIHY